MNRLRLTLLVLFALVAGFGWLWHRAEQRRPQGSDLEQIQALVLEARDDAGRRDASAVLRHVSRHYRDPNGFTYPILARQVRRILAEQDPSIVAEVQSIRLEAGGERATADVYVRVTGDPGVAPLPIDTTLHLSLAKEQVRFYVLFPGRQWKVTAVTGYGVYGEF